MATDLLTPRRYCAFVTLLALLTGGCASERPSRAEHVTPPIEEAVPEMSGHAAFLAGQLEADVLLNRAGFGPRGEREAGASARGGDSGRRSGGFRGGFGGGRGRRGDRGESEGRSDSAEDAPAAHITPSNQPPVRLHLKLTNNTDAPLEVEVPQFDSDLGNFVVQPAKISVPPHGSAAADPMTSRLGIPADQVPITVTIRVNGTTEHQVLFLRLKPDSATPPPTAP